MWHSLKYFLLSFSDPELSHLKKEFEGKFLIEPLKTKINRHCIFWVGRSELDNDEIRFGIKFERKISSQQSVYFYSLDSFREDKRLGDYLLMTAVEANALEEKILTQFVKEK